MALMRQYPPDGEREGRGRGGPWGLPPDGGAPAPESGGVSHGPATPGPALPPPVEPSPPAAPLGPSSLAAAAAPVAPVTPAPPLPVGPEYNFPAMPIFKGPEFQSPEFKAPSYEGLISDPGYQFRLAAGQEALERSAAARGSLRTGGTLKDILEYGQNLGSQEYGAAFGRAKDIYGADYQRAKDAYTAAYERARDEYAPKLAEWETLTEAEKIRALAEFQRRWEEYVFANTPRGGGGGGGGWIAEPPTPPGGIPPEPVPVATPEEQERRRQERERRREGRGR